jgi:hypothetical protein
MPNPHDIFDYSQGSTNTYLVEKRHGLIPPCLYCKEYSKILLDGAKYWQFFQSSNPPHIQNVWPSLEPAKREHILKGIHPECWIAMFPEEES